MAISSQEWERVRLEAREGAFYAINKSMKNMRMAMREEAGPIAKQVTKDHLDTCPTRRIAESNRKTIKEVRISLRKMITLVVMASLGGGGVSRLPDILKALSGLVQ